MRAPFYSFILFLPSHCHLLQLQSLPLCPQSPCLSCSSVVLIPGEDQDVEDGAVHNGGHEDVQANGSKVRTSCLSEDFKCALVQ